MTNAYGRPTITSELGRSSDVAVERNSYSRGTRSNYQPKIDGVSIDDLAETYGSPLFVFSERTIRAKARRARKAFDAAYSRTSFAWSYKTNYLNAICRIFHQEGWIAEVVSEFEYQKARRLGVAAKEIVFNGPHKSREILERALSEGALIQIDNWDELSLVEDIAPGLDHVAEVGIRIWLDAGVRPVWSKFGFALANGEALRAAARIIANPRLKLHTLHTHIGTYILTPDAYHTAAEKLLALREQLRQEHGRLAPCINLGGGFPSNSLLHGMEGPAETQIPPIEAYANAIGESLNRLPKSQRPLLRLESGRALVDEAGSLVTTVVAVKGTDRARRLDLSGFDVKAALILGDNARTGYIVDSGVNLLYTGAWYQIGATPVRPIGGPPAPARLYGCLCMAIDVIRDYVELPPLETGDRLVLHPVGAYNVTQSMQFIAYRPAIVLVGEDGGVDLIREREKLEDVERCERVPERLLAK